MGGKGGVGKTTCAAALGVRAAADGLRTLIVSTDPAPSLGDALGRPLGAAPRAIAVPRGVLHAVEIDAAAALRRWIGARAHVLEEIAHRGTWLDRADISRLLTLSLPGADELGGLLELLRYGGSGSYDLIILDTAPTGHTLRMLAMPPALSGLADLFVVMQEKHRAIVEALGGAWRVDAADRLIHELEGNARELSALLTDPARLAVWWVTLPEDLSVEETLDAAGVLAAASVPVQRIVVNRMTPPPRSRCTWCRGRRASEARAVASLVSAWPRRVSQRPPTIPELVSVSASETEPIGIRALRTIGRQLEASATPLGARGSSRPVRALPRRRRAVAATAFDVGSVRLVMFGGKGGVGKTTCAAAAALGAAQQRPARRILLLSVDPAHSLGDALEAPLTDAPQDVAGAPQNLHARELDARAALDRVRHRYGESIDALFNRLTRGFGIDVSHDRRVVHALIDLAPPGLDELAAILEVVALLYGPRPAYDVIVVDTAPTGHALRLLETPTLVQDWTKALMGVLLKYQPVIGIGPLGSVLLELSKSLTRLRALLVDPALTQFVAVSRPDALTRAETARLLARLRRIRVHVKTVVINGLGHGSCARCRRAAASEARGVASLAATVRRLGIGRIIATPAEAPPPRGRVRLARWRAAWELVDS